MRMARYTINTVPQTSKTLYRTPAFEIEIWGTICVWLGTVSPNHQQRHWELKGVTFWHDPRARSQHTYPGMQFQSTAWARTAYGWVGVFSQHECVYGWVCLHSIWMGGCVFTAHGSVCLHSMGVFAQHGCVYGSVFIDWPSMAVMLKESKAVHSTAQMLGRKQCSSLGCSRIMMFIKFTTVLDYKRVCHYTFDRVVPCAETMYVIKCYII